MDPQDPNTPTKPAVDHTNPFDKFFNDTSETASIDTSTVQTEQDIQQALNEMTASPSVQPEPLEMQGNIPTPATGEVPEVPVAPAPPSPPIPPAPAPSPLTDVPNEYAGIAKDVEQVANLDVPPKDFTKTDTFIPAHTVKVQGRKLITGIVLFLVMAIFGAVMAMVVSGNADFLPLLPFAKKDAAYVINKALGATAELSSYHYDVSASVDFDSQQFGIMSGDSQFDIKAVGDIAFTETGEIDKMQTNIALQSSAAELTGQISANFVTTKEKAYVQLDTVTGALSSFGEFLPPAGTWYYSDISQLESQARAALESTITPSEEDALYESMKGVLQTMYEQESVKKEITLTGKEKLSDNTSAYRLHMEPSSETMAQFIATSANAQGSPMDPEDQAILKESLNDFSQFVIDTWIDEDSYIMRKVQVVISYAYNYEDVLPALPIVFNPNGPLVAGATKVLAESEVKKDTVNLSFVAEFTNINQTPVITIPTESAPIEEYIETVFGGFLGNAENSMVMSDIGQISTALNAYYIDNNGKYPTQLDMLTINNEYLASIPQISERDGCVITDYRQGYLTSLTTDEIALYADLTPCNTEEKTYYVYWSACGFPQEMQSAPQPSQLDEGVGC